MEKDKIKLVKPSKEYERQAIEYKKRRILKMEKKEFLLAVSGIK